MPWEWRPWDSSVSGGARLALTEEELILNINKYLNNPQRDAAGRQRIRDELLYKVDGQSGKRVADALLCALLDGEFSPAD